MLHDNKHFLDIILVIPYSLLSDHYEVALNANYQLFLPLFPFFLFECKGVGGVVNN